MKPEKIDKMDDENYRDLARKAWELSKAAETVQKLLLQMFLDEFMKLDEAEFNKQFACSNDPPF